MPDNTSSGDEAATAWAAEWLARVADGTHTMSQRKLSTVERHGGLDAARAVAEGLGVHLLILEDDRGDPLVAASTKPFRVVC